jgi:predicted Zn finger-like uncharacterized protein
MILTCPACSTRFALDAHALGTAGRRVRCGSCRHVWHAAAPEVEEKTAEAAAARSAPATPAPAEPFRARIAAAGEGAPPRPPVPSSRDTRVPRRTSAAGLAWSALALVVIVVIGGAVVAKDEILAAWPESARIYAAFGMSSPAIGSGLELRKVNWRRETADSVPLLLIDGEIANSSQSVRSVPKIRAAIVGKDGRELESWVFAPPKVNLVPGEAVPFHTELKNPPEEADRLTMVFTNGL